MASERHLELAGIVKKVHADLREKTRNSSQDLLKIWQDHINDQPLLHSYAEAMRELAQEIWSKNSFTRIDWCRNVCMEYFHGRGLEKQLEKDKRRAAFKAQTTSEDTIKFDEEAVNIPSAPHSRPKQPLNTMEMKVNSDETHNQDVHCCCQISLPFTRRIRLLDVGSCYAAFKNLPEFVSVAIDIAPANELVHQCDFLDLNVSRPLNHDEAAAEKILTSLPNKVTSFPGETFDVVVFSLLLEYLPTPTMRYRCCIKAWQLLAQNGLLLIITPDSKHQNKNAPMMKSWKQAIEKIGFSRWKYVKLEHLHCMAFRKNTSEAQCNDASNDTVAELLYIPQDFSCLDTMCSEQCRTDEGNVEVSDSVCLQELSKFTFFNDEES